MTQSTKKRPKSTQEQNQTRGDDRKPRKYPEQVRAKAVSLVRQRRAEGVGFGACAKELGISAWALRNWLKTADSTASKAAQQASPSASPWRKVALSTGTPSGIADAQLSLTTPSGYRLEGLSLEQALVALGRLP